MALYSYLRVSKRNQSLNRQIDSILEKYPDIPKANIYYDKMSGATFDRKSYQLLKEKLQKGDVLLLHELDRLGRNKEEIKKELAWFKEHGVILRIFNLPTTQTEFPEGQAWIGDMVNNILLEVYSSLAEQERVRISTRTKEGIAAAAKRGAVLGRPRIDDNVVNLAMRMYKTGYFEIADILEFTGMSRSSFFNYAAKRGIKKPKDIERFERPRAATLRTELVLSMYESGEFSLSEISEYLSLSKTSILNHVRNHNLPRMRKIPFPGQKPPSLD